MLQNNKNDLSFILILLTCFIQSCSQLSAQSSILDSLRIRVTKTESDLEKAELYIAMCEEVFSLPQDSFMVYAHAIKDIGIKNKNEKMELAGDYWIMYAYNKIGRNDTCIALINKQLGKKYTDPDLQFIQRRFKQFKGNVLNLMSEGRKAQEVFYEILQEAESANDLYNQGYALNGIGWSFELQGLDTMSIHYYKRAMNLTTGIKDRKYIMLYGVALSNLINSYIRNFRSEHFKDSSYKYEEFGIPYFEKNELNGLLASALSEKALWLGDKSKDEGEALYKEALAIRRKLGNPYYYQLELSKLILFYINTAQYAKAIPVCKEGIASADSLKIDILLIQFYTYLAANYRAMGDFKSYGDLSFKLSIIKDSLYKLNGLKELAALQTKYEVQKKENTIMQQKLTITNKNSLLYGSLGALLSTLLISIIFLQNRKKTHQLHLKALELHQKTKLTHAVLQAEDQERKRIAAELHDNVAQKIVAAKINLHAIKTMLPDHLPKLERAYYNASTLIDESASDVRSLSHTMMTSSVGQESLVWQINELINKINIPHLKIECNQYGEDNLGPDKRTMIYRIVQEAIQNALKHSESTMITILLDFKTRPNKITIEDNGKGFQMLDIVASESIGFKNMKSRADFIDCQLTINSSLHQGTQISLVL